MLSELFPLCLSVGKFMENDKSSKIKTIHSISISRLKITNGSK